MVYRRKRTFRKKRPARTRRYRRRALANYNPAPARPFADKYRCNLRYCQTGSIDPSNTNFAFHTFCVNSLYDPDTTGGGHQPMGFDQLAAIYNRYLVTGAKLSCTFESRTATTNQTAIVGVTTHEGSLFYPSTLSDVTKLIE